MQKSNCYCWNIVKFKIFKGKVANLFWIGVIFHAAIWTFIFNRKTYPYLNILFYWNDLIDAYNDCVRVILSFINYCTFS